MVAALSVPTLWGITAATNRKTKRFSPRRFGISSLATFSLFATLGKAFQDLSEKQLVNKNSSSSCLQNTYSLEYLKFDAHVVDDELFLKYFEKF